MDCPGDQSAFDQTREKRRDGSEPERCIRIVKERERQGRLKKVQAGLGEIRIPAPSKTTRISGISVDIDGPYAFFIGEYLFDVHLKIT